MTDLEPTPKPRAIVIEDEEPLAAAIKAILVRHGVEVEVFTQAVEALHALADVRPDVALVDINLPHFSGLDLLTEIKKKNPSIEVIMMTGQGSVESAVQALKSGAYDYLTKPFSSVDDVARVVLKAYERKYLRDRNRELEHLAKNSVAPAGFVGQSQRMREVFSMIDRVSYSSSTVLVQGESGTGKELVARTVHQRSPRKDKPFVALNCAALTETLLESELFGHTKGAFTGATANKKGLFEAATGGTLFLDEIGDMPPQTQVRLLRTLEDGEVRAVGATSTIRVDVRVIAATNVDLQKAVRQGKFREDLFYRLNVISVHLPPLRDRPTDVPLLAHHFLRLYASKLGKTLKGFTPEAMEALVSNRWQGNVRELENVVERAVVLARDGDVGLDDLPASLSNTGGAGESDVASLSTLPYSQAKRLAVAAFDKRYLGGLLKKSKGNIAGAATIAGLDRSNFRRLLKQYGMANARTGGVDGAPVDAATAAADAVADQAEADESAEGVH